MKPSPFLTLAHMRDEHTALTTGYRVRRDDTEVMEAAKAFIARGRVTGAILEGVSERAAAQTMLDYWATVVFRQTSDSPAATLAEFEPLGDTQLDDRDCPYPGSRPFDAHMRPNFHGRQKLVSELLTVLESQECLCLVGAAGVGTTSLLNAGLLPALRETQQQTTRILPDGSSEARTRKFLPPIVPGSDPLGNLNKAIGAGDALRVEGAGRPDPGPGLGALLDDVAPGGAVLVVDGLEELFTLCRDVEARAAFATAIVELAQRPRNHLLILTVRAAWMGDLASLEDLHAVVQKHMFDVPPLTGREMLEAVLGPAARVGLKFQEDLAETLARDFLHEPPALLQLALTTLWRHRDGTRVSWHAYAAVGRGRGLLANQAEATDVVIGSPNEQMIRAIFLAFVQRGSLPGQIRTVRIERNRLLGLGVASAVHETLDRLVSSQLLRTSETNLGVVRLEWLHDVLKDAVPAIGTWLHESELREIKAVADRERERANREARLKRRARRLAWAFGVAAAAAFLLTYVVLKQLSERQVLLMASASQRVAQSNPDLAMALAAGAMELSEGGSVASGALYKAYFESASRRVYPGTWVAAGDAKPVSAVRVTGDRRFAVVGDVTGRVTVWDLQSDATQWVAQLDEADRAVSAVAVTPTGDLVMAGTEAGAIVLLDGRTGARLDKWTHHESGVRVQSIAFSSDGERAASGSADDTVWLWNRSGPAPRTWRQLDAASEGHRSSVRAVDFSPDNRLMFSGEEDFGTVIAWDVTTGNLVGKLATSPAAELRTLAIAPTGCMLLTGATDGTVTLFHVGTAFPGAAKYLRKECASSSAAPTPLAGSGQDPVTSVAFGPDDRYAISGSQDWTVTLWQTAGGRLDRLKTFRGHQGRVQSVTFPGGDFFVSGSTDGSVRVWSLEATLAAGRLAMNTIVGNPHANGTPVVDRTRADVHAVGLSPDGRSAYAAAFMVPRNQVQIVRWDIETGRAASLVRTDYSGTLPSILDGSSTRGLTGTNPGLTVWDFNSEGARSMRRFPEADPAAAALNGRTAAWISDRDWRLFVTDVESDAPAREVATLQDTPVDERNEPVFALAISRDGNRIAVGTQRNRVLLFDTRSTNTAGVAFEPRHGTRVTAVALHPHGRTLASGSSDGTIILWDSDGQELGRLRGHTGIVRALAFSPDGELLLSAAEGTEGLLLWHVASRIIVHTFGGQSGVRTATISTDGRRALTASADGILNGWTLPDLDHRKLLDSVRRTRWVRGLTENEEKEFGLSGFLDFLILGRIRQ